MELPKVITVKLTPGHLARGQRMNSGNDPVGNWLTDQYPRYKVQVSTHATHLIDMRDHITRGVMYQHSGEMIQFIKAFDAGRPAPVVEFEMWLMENSNPAKPAKRGRPPKNPDP